MHIETSIPNTTNPRTFRRQRIINQSTKQTYTKTTRTGRREKEHQTQILKTNLLRSAARSRAPRHQQMSKTNKQTQKKRRKLKVHRNLDCQQTFCDPPHVQEHLDTNKCLKQTDKHEKEEKKPQFLTNLLNPRTYNSISASTNALKKKQTNKHTYKSNKTKKSNKTNLLRSTARARAFRHPTARMRCP